MLKPTPLLRRLFTSASLVLAVATSSLPFSSQAQIPDEVRAAEAMESQGPRFQLRHSDNLITRHFFPVDKEPETRQEIFKILRDYFAERQDFEGEEASNMLYILARVDNTLQIGETALLQGIGLSPEAFSRMTATSQKYLFLTTYNNFLHRATLDNLTEIHGSLELYQGYMKSINDGAQDLRNRYPNDSDFNVRDLTEEDLRSIRLNAALLVADLVEGIQTNPDLISNEEAQTAIDILSYYSENIVMADEYNREILPLFFERLQMRGHGREQVALMLRQLYEIANVYPEENVTKLGLREEWLLENPTQPRIENRHTFVLPRPGDGISSYANISIYGMPDINRPESYNIVVQGLRKYFDRHINYIMDTQARDVSQILVDIAEATRMRMGDLFQDIGLSREAALRLDHVSGREEFLEQYRNLTADPRIERRAMLDQLESSDRSIEEINTGLRILRQRTPDDPALQLNVITPEDMRNMRRRAVSIAADIMENLSMHLQQRLRVDVIRDLALRGNSEHAAEILINITHSRYNPNPYNAEMASLFFEEMERRGRNRSQISTMVRELFHHANIKYPGTYRVPSDLIIDERPVIQPSQP